MKLRRRQLLQLAAVSAALPAASCFAWAQSYPSRPVRLVSAVAAGGMSDTIARLIGQRLSERLGQPFVVENRSGGGTNIGTEAVVRAPADGYTLLVIGPTAASNATLYSKLNFNFIRDIAPVAAISREPNVMVVHPSIPAKTISEFIAYVRAHPGTVNVASSGNGGGGHLCAELFKMMTGVNMLHVPYRGGAPAITDLLGGQVQVMFASTASSLAYIKSGHLRPLAVTTATRSQALPDIPTVDEFVSGYEASTWFGVSAPKDTPTQIIHTLNNEINAVLAEPSTRARFADLVSEPLVGSPADFGKLIAEETEKWAKVIKFAGIKAG